MNANNGSETYPPTIEGDAMVLRDRAPFFVCTEPRTHDPPPQKTKNKRGDILAKAEQTKEQRVKSEIRKLEKNFKDIEEKRKNVAKGLIERAAFLKISLEDLERDINENGVTELFSQGDQKPYLRKRPAAEIYNNFNGNYQKIIKQLTDLLPKEAPAPKVGDEFDNF